MSGVKRRSEFQGLPLNIEIEAGETRGGTGEDGKPWEHTYAFPYGELCDTMGADGDPVDVYVGSVPAAPNVLVVHQRFLSGTFDEDKAMMGFPDEAAAEAAYRAHGPSWGWGGSDWIPLAEFVEQYVRTPKYPPRLGLEATP